MLNNVTVPAEFEGRLDAFLVTVEPDRTRGEIQGLVEKGYVSVNGKQATKNSLKLKGGNTIAISYPEPVTELVEEPFDLPILFEDDSIVILDKPAGIIVHPNDMEQTGTIVQALLSRYPNIKEAVYDAESEVSKLRPGIVHRLDRDTSGVLVVAKTAAAMQTLSAQFHDHSIEKTYVALTVGRDVKEETVTTDIKRKPFERTMMGVAPTGEGREAITHIKPVQIWNVKNTAITLAEFKIETGRTHQIRVHCKFRGHPILGDELYQNATSKMLGGRLGAERQLLHAAKLTLTHPTTLERMTFESPLPADFNLILTKLGPADRLV